MVYQDALTQQWATELWERVGHLVETERIDCQSWSISHLIELRAFAGAVQAAAAAEVVVVAVRSAGDLPLMLRAWIDAWMAERAGRAGALVAVIGLPAQPDAQSNRAYQHLEVVARQAGLDFLPQERKLPEETLALPTRGGITSAAGLTLPWPGGGLSADAGAQLHWRLTE